MIQLVIYLAVAGEEEILGVRDFSFPPSAGDSLEITHQGEKLRMRIKEVRHRVDEQGHMPHLVCERENNV